jgi:hypothetical protein
MTQRTGLEPRDPSLLGQSTYDDNASSLHTGHGQAGSLENMTAAFCLKKMSVKRF